MKKWAEIFSLVIILCGFSGQTVAAPVERWNVDFNVTFTNIIQANGIQANVWTGNSFGWNTSGGQSAEIVIPDSHSDSVEYVGGFNNYYVPAFLDRLAFDLKSEKFEGPTAVQGVTLNYNMTFTPSDNSSVNIPITFSMPIHFYNGDIVCSNGPGEFQNELAPFIGYSSVYRSFVYQDIIYGAWFEFDDMHGFLGLAYDGNANLYDELGLPQDQRYLLSNHHTIFLMSVSIYVRDMPPPPVPVPAAVCLLGSGLAGLGVLRKKWANG